MTIPEVLPVFPSDWQVRICHPWTIPQHQLHAQAVIPIVPEPVSLGTTFGREPHRKRTSMKWSSVLTSDIRLVQLYSDHIVRNSVISLHEKELTDHIVYPFHQTKA